MVRHPGDERSCWLPPPAVCRCRLTPWLPPAPPQMDKQALGVRAMCLATTRVSIDVKCHLSYAHITLYI